MRQIEVALVVVSPTTQRGGSQVLLLESGGAYRLPAAFPGEQESTHGAAATLLRDQTGLRARTMGVGWVDLVQLPLVEEVSTAVERRHQSGGDPWLEMVRAPRPALLVTYGAILPGELVKLRDGSAKWVPTAEAFGLPFHEDHKEVLQAAVARM